MSQRNRHKNSENSNHHDQMGEVKMEMLKNAVPVAKAWSELSIALLKKTTKLVEKSQKPEEVVAAMNPIFELWGKASDVISQFRDMKNSSHDHGNGTH